MVLIVVLVVVAWDLQPVISDFVVTITNCHTDTSIEGRAIVNTLEDPAAIRTDSAGVKAGPWPRRSRRIIITETTPPDVEDSLYSPADPLWVVHSPTDTLGSRWRRNRERRRPIYSPKSLWNFTRWRERPVMSLFGSRTVQSVDTYVREGEAA